MPQNVFNLPWKKELNFGFLILGNCFHISRLCLIFEWYKISLNYIPTFSFWIYRSFQMELFKNTIFHRRREIIWVSRKWSNLRECRTGRRIQEMSHLSRFKLCSIDEMQSLQNILREIFQRVNRSLYFNVMMKVEAYVFIRSINWEIWNVLLFFGMIMVKSIIHL